ncbi:MAG: M23 family peptidase [Variovorax sp.]|nr:MAG: M23 family peptidase [Variovorax sp.]
MPFSTFAFRACGYLVAAVALVACHTPQPTPAKPVAPAAGSTGSIPPLNPQARFQRPAAGIIIERFNGKTNKGIDFAGQRGDPVVASAEGRVVIVSSALRAMGTMVIVKHDDTFLTAYAHLDRSLVKEDDVVRRGQKIGEMGKSGTNRVKLHFELRKQGVAVNPEPYLRGRVR